MSRGNVLLTGASGFVGLHMGRLLAERGYRVVGLQRGGTALPQGVEPLSVDLSDPAALSGLPREWDLVVHLAGASIPSLFNTVAPIGQNVTMTLNLLEHLMSARVLLVSSCHVYAPSVERKREDHPVQPQGRYGLSKHLIEQIAPHYQRKLDLRVARAFNHLGPGQRAELVVPSLLRRLASARGGDRSPLVMHGLNSVRDFIDVRDVAEAYLAILELPAPRERVFNVCTGLGRNIGDLAAEVLRILGANREVVFEQRALSSDDNPVLVGDPGRLREASGFAPRRTLTDSLQAMVAALPAERPGRASGARSGGGDAV